jgi:hypothetical protein
VGYVTQIVVRNTGATPTTGWSVEVDMRGSTLNGNPWAAVASPAGGHIVFAAETYNAALASGATATFGFQGAAANASQRPVIVAVNRTTAQGTGGTPGTGGTRATGGAMATGGSTSTGGTRNTGGALATGGAPATGGVPAKGGSTSNTGGTVSGGGSGVTGGARSEFQFSVQIPVDVPISEVVIGANGRLLVGDHALVPPNGGIPIWPTVANANPVSTELAAQSLVGSLEAAGNVSIRNGASVRATLVAPQYTPELGAYVGHWISAVPQFKTLSRTVSVPALTDAWTFIDGGRTDTLPPGAYGNYSVRTNSGLTLAPGRYYFKSLWLEPEARLTVSGTGGNTYVYVVDDFVFRGQETLSTAENGLFVGVLGDRDTLLERVFSGAVVAPNSSLYISDVGAGIHTGQFFGKNVEVRSAARVNLKPFTGFGDDGDECTWGKTPDSSCTFDVACPGTSERKCVQDACTCVVGPGATPTDNCSHPVLSADNRVILQNEAKGTSCGTAYQCSGTSNCDGNGYCICEDPGPNDGSECTEPATSSTGTSELRPVMDGTQCSSYTGSCLVQATCAGGVCSCTQVPTVPGTNPDCKHAGMRCVGYDCLDGTCTASGTCECTYPASLPNGHPVRLGTQNVHGLPGFAKSLAGCVDSSSMPFTSPADFVCEGNKMAAKILQSNYDIIAFNEVFDDGYRQALLDNLYTGGNGPFKYGITKADSNSLSLLNSGLMLLSRWPFADRDPQDDACFRDNGQLEAVGDGVFSVQQANYGGGLGTFAGVIMSKALHFEMFEDGYGPDYHAAKGVGHARIVSPSGVNIDVFFTHLQAHDKSTTENITGADVPDYFMYTASEPYRRAQIFRVNDIIQCVMSHRGGTNNVVMLAGDLNINGDLSNPLASLDLAYMCKGDRCGILNTDPLWDNPVQTFNEWKYHFDRNANGDISAMGLTDTWAYDMTPGCIARVDGVRPTPECRVTTYDSKYPTTAQNGPVLFDRSASQSINTDGEERLDYVLLGQAPGATYTFGAQHVARAYNLLDGNWTESSFSRVPANQLSGADPISDHYGLNIEMDDKVANMNPANALADPQEPWGRAGAKQMTLPYATAVHWFKITQPGDYVFSVNPKDYVLSDTTAGPDNGLSFQVFENTNLSQPMAPFKGEVLQVPPGEQESYGGPEFMSVVYRPAYRQGKFVSPNFPLYVKVFASDPSKLQRSKGRYVFYYHKLGCTNKDEACTLLPYGTLLGDEGEANPLASQQAMAVLPHPNEAWYALNIERPDNNMTGQSIRIFVAERADEPPTVDTVYVMGTDGQTILNNIQFSQRQLTTHDPYRSNALWNVWEYAHGHYGVLTNTNNTEGSANGTKYYVKVIKRDSAYTDDNPDDILIGWSTGLTWIYGRGMGGDACNLLCKDTQEASQDEIYMKLVDFNTGWPTPFNSGDATSGLEIMSNYASGAGSSSGSSHEWTETFFNRLTAKKHPDGSTFQQIPALGFVGALGIDIWEDDYNVDEEASLALYSSVDFPKRAQFKSGTAEVIFDNDWPSSDGVYHVEACNFSHYLGVRKCKTNAECASPLVCNGGTCVTAR